ncbi:hypothetical protein SLA2020_287250 [Shorea laevis]
MTRDFILARINEFGQAYYTAHKPKTLTTVLVGWSPPPLGSLKLNIDDSTVTNPSAAGVGGVFRDDIGSLVFTAILGLPLVFWRNCGL